METMTGTVGHDLCEAVGGYLIVSRALILACRCRNGTIVIDGDSGRAGSVSCSLFLLGVVCLGWTGFGRIGPRDGVGQAGPWGRPGWYHCRCCRT